MASQNPELPAPAPPSPAIRNDSPVTTGATVTVACKLPHGLILRIFEMEEYQEPMRDGSWKTMERAREIPDKRFVVRGTWVGSAGQAYARGNSAVAELLPGGYAITHGCPKELWDIWHKQNKESMLVKNRVIFAHPDHASVTQSAQSNRDVTSGMEPIHPDNPGERLGRPAATPPGARLRAIGRLETDEGTSPR